MQGAGFGVQQVKQCALRCRMLGVGFNNITAMLPHTRAMPTQYDHRKVEWPPPLPPLVMTRLEGLKVHAVEVTDPQRHSVHIHGAPAHVPAGRLVRAANGDVHRVCRLCRGWGALGDCRYVREQSRMGHPYTRTRKVHVPDSLNLHTWSLPKC